MSLSRDTLVGLLDELAQWLEFEGVGSVELLVCGGVALALQNLNTRTTRDVDVLGEWKRALLEVTCIDDFPEDVKSCIKRVAKNHPELQGFTDDWVNLGPKHLAKHGLPAGFESRLRMMKFGKTLTLHLLSRTDLIPLKLYAASDRFGPRQSIHFDDLKLLNGSFEELDKALEWVAHSMTSKKNAPRFRMCWKGWATMTSQDTFENTFRHRLLDLLYGQWVLLVHRSPIEGLSS